MDKMDDESKHLVLQMHPDHNSMLKKSWLVLLVHSLVRLFFLLKTWMSRLSLTVRQSGLGLGQGTFYLLYIRRIQQIFLRNNKKVW